MEGKRGRRGRFSGVCERQQETETMWKFDLHTCRCENIARFMKKKSVSETERALNLRKTEI